MKEIDLTPDAVRRKLDAIYAEELRELERMVTRRIRRNLWGAALLAIALGWLIARWLP